MENYPLEFYTLTPLWTGDVDINSPRIQETSVIGSLRWWYRQILRSIPRYKDEFICDATAEDHEKRCSDDKNICPVCELFGCTGHARQFRLTVDGLENQDLFFVTHADVYPSNGNWLKNVWQGSKEGKGKEVKFFLAKKTLFLEPPRFFTVKVYPREPGRRGWQAVDRIKSLLGWVAHYGALGARTQNGFGQIRLKTPVRAWPEEDFPDPSRFFSLTFELGTQLGRYQSQVRYVGQPPAGFADHHRAPFIPCAFDLRYKTRSRNPYTGRVQDVGLRFHFAKVFRSREVADLLFGETRAGKLKSRVHVSHIYRDEPNGPFRLKIFGFVPENAETPNTKNIKQEVINFLATKINGEEIFPHISLIDSFTQHDSDV